MVHHWNGGAQEVGADTGEDHGTWVGRTGYEVGGAVETVGHCCSGPDCTGGGVGGDGTAVYVVEGESTVQGRMAVHWERIHSDFCSCRLQ